MKHVRQETGCMVISLDFELMWGVWDHHTVDSYGETVIGGRKAIPALLKLFEEKGIHATWAAVGFLFADTREECERYFPRERPTYTNPALSGYTYWNQVGENEETDPYSFAPSLIELIGKCPFQEIGTHTFSHYYCREDGQTAAQFEADILSARRIQQDKLGIGPVSVIFPRNQCRSEYVSLLTKHGIHCYRGYERASIYSPPQKSKWKRLFRLADAYINLAGHMTNSVGELLENGIVNVRSSRFFRAYMPRLRLLENLKLRRIKGQMKYAAKHGRVFHLWWHPHNFGRHTDTNLAQMTELLTYYQQLHTLYGFRSVNMGELAAEVMK